MNSSAAFEIDPARLIAHSQAFEPLVHQATAITKDLAAALSEGTDRPGHRDVFEISFSVAHDGLAAETERQICLLPETIHEFGRSFLLAARLYQAGDQYALDRIAELSRSTSSPDTRDG